MIKGSIGNKRYSINTCIECDTPCKVVKVVRSKTARQRGLLTGMIWMCDNGHSNRTRKHELVGVRK